MPSPINPLAASTGFQSGLQQAERLRQEQRADRLRAEDAPVREVEQRLRDKRLEALSADLEFQSRLRQREAADFTRADTAYASFEKAANALSWSQPDSLQAYQKLQQQYLPEISRHKTVLGKYDALNQAVMTSQDLTDRNAMLTATADLRRQLLNRGFGSEALGITSAVKRGEKTLEQAAGEMSDLLKYAHDTERTQTHAEQMDLRRAPVDARIAGELRGAYGGTTPYGAGAADQPGPAVRKARQGALIDDYKDISKRLRTARAALDTLKQGPPGPDTPARITEEQGRVNTLEVEHRRLDRELRKLETPSQPATDPASQPSSQPTAPPAAETLPAKTDAIRQAHEALQQGKDPTAVRHRFRELYGEELP